MKKTHNDCLAPEDKKQVELADIFRRYEDDYRRSHPVSYQQLKVMHNIKICRTAKLGGHIEQCDQCGFEQIAYNSCRNRHCPKCQTLTKEKWLNDRKAELLGCCYFHLVFTLPHDLLLFDAYLKDKLVFSKKTAAFKSRQAFQQLINSVSNKRWIAYAKRPFAGPQQVLEYLGRYTHRVAISNNRILCIDNGRVTFTYRDRQNDNEIKKMTLEADEFIRRFLLHVLPKGLIKIRYFGFLAHTNKKKDIPLIRKLIDADATLPEKINESISEMMLRLTGIDISCCPKCKKGKMIRIRKLPNYYLNSS